MNTTITKQKNIFGLLLGPLLFISILLLAKNGYVAIEIGKVLAVAAWMIIWWMTEAVPIPVTALLPIILFPSLGVFGLKEATAPYASPIIFLFMGGFLIALALEKHNLHKRIALNLIKLTGTSGNRIILGFMLATALLSMWISNTATTVMMLPIATSVITLVVGDKDDKPHRLFALGLLLSIAYSANIGGTATIIGTPPNVVLIGYMKEFYNYEVAFGKWMLVGVPIAFILLVFTFIIITKVLFPSKLKSTPEVEKMIHQRIVALGKFSKEERLVTTVFGITTLGWIFKQQINSLVGFTLLSDTITAMMGGVLMFALPTNLKKGEFLMDWESTKKMPWGILILFGGGLCLAKAMEVSGIIQLIGDSISSNEGIQIWMLILMLTGVMLFMTELMSNVALTTIFVPVVLGIANGLDILPIMIAIPVTIAASCAFMMPISTPPNAIVFASGRIKVKDMMRAGLLLNFVSIFTLLLAALTIIKWVY